MVCDSGQLGVVTVGVDLEQVAALAVEGAYPEQRVVAELAQLRDLGRVRAVQVDPGNEGAAMGEGLCGGRVVGQRVDHVFGVLDDAQTRLRVERALDTLYGANPRKVVRGGGDGPGGGVDGVAQFAGQQLESDEHRRRLARGRAVRRRAGSGRRWVVGPTPWILDAGPAPRAGRGPRPCVVAVFRGQAAGPRAGRCRPRRSAHGRWWPGHRGRPPPSTARHQGRARPRPGGWRCGRTSPPRRVSRPAGRRRTRHRPTVRPATPGTRRRRRSAHPPRRAAARRRRDGRRGR